MEVHPRKNRSVMKGNFRDELKFEKVKADLHKLAIINSSNLLISLNEPKSMNFVVGLVVNDGCWWSP